MTKSMIRVVLVSPRLAPTQVTPPRQRICRMSVLNMILELLRQLRLKIAHIAIQPPDEPHILMHHLPMFIQHSFLSSGKITLITLYNIQVFVFNVNS